MEVKGGPNSDPYADPWQAARDAKKRRIEKNTENQIRNQERAGLLAKGTATRYMKQRERARINDARSNVPSGVPIDLPRSTTAGGGGGGAMKRGKELTKLALTATQRSTASMGIYDGMREGEPERKNAIRKQVFESNTPPSQSQSNNKKSGGGAKAEKERSMKLLDSVLSGGVGNAKAKERARRNGSLAKGETAYDYDFDDGGYNGGSFKKKKGRAGAGKNKKLTKKRIK